ncbi:hypothetical protein ABE10_01525, partial [Bacillus toyonensis]|nr:hypothetical protein [Bacillus toyonensis]
LASRTARARSLPRGPRRDAPILRASAVDRAERLGIHSRQPVTLPEEPCTGEQLHDGVCEDHEDEHVDQRRETEREREALHRRVGEDIQHHGGEHVDRLGDVDRALGPRPTVLHRAGDGLAVAQLVPDPLEVDDERVGGEADRDDEARDPGERETEAHAPGEDADDHIGQHRHHADRGDDDEAERSIAEQRVDGHERQADEPRDEADLELLRSEGRRHGVGALHREAQRKGSVTKLVGEALGALLGEAPADAGLAVEDDAVHRWRRDHRAVQHEGELVPRAEPLALVGVEALADVAEGLGPLVVERQVDRPLARVLLPAVRRVRDGVSVELDRSQEVFDLAGWIAGDQRLVGRRAGRVFPRRGAVIGEELGLQPRGDPRQVAAVRRRGGGRRGQRGVGSRIRRLFAVLSDEARRRVRRGEDRSQLELRALLDTVPCLVVDLAGDLDDDVAPALGGDVCLAD